MADRSSYSPIVTTTMNRMTISGYLLATVISLLLGATSIVRGTRALTSVSDSDLTNFFLKSAGYVLNGAFWHMYAARASPPLSNVPNDGTPLSIFLMAPLLGLARTLGFATSIGDRFTFVALPFTLLVPLLGYIVLRQLHHQNISEVQRFIAFLLVTLSPLIWLTYSPWGHLELPLMLCFLVAAVIALQARHEVFAGVLAGLAVYSAVTAIFPLIALAVMLLAHREWRSFLKVGGVGVVIVVIGMAPFLFFDRSNTVYSLLSWRGGAHIGGNSVWSLFAFLDNSSSPALHIVGGIVRRLDIPATLLFCVVVAFVAARRIHISAYSPEAWGVLSIAALALPMLTKLNWPYYYLAPFILLIVWEFGTLQNHRSELWRWPVLTIGFLLMASTFSQYIGLKSVGTLDRIVLGILEFGVMLTFIFASWKRIPSQ